MAHHSCWQGHAAATTSSMLQLDDDSCMMPAKKEIRPPGGMMTQAELSPLVVSTRTGNRMDNSNLPDDSLTHMFFCKPVEGNLAHHTVMGQQLRKFDFLVQRYILVEAEWDVESHRWMSVTVVQHGPPITCQVSHIPFDVLSKNLNMWTSSETGYRVFLKM